MVKAWYIKEISATERELIREINLDELYKATGVLYYKIDPNDFRNKVDELKDKYEYKREDIVAMGPGIMDDFDGKRKKFATEHLHMDEEVRFALEGAGYLEIRDKDDRWIRLFVQKGDFLILPERIHHRFFFLENNTTGKVLPIRFLRLFKDNSPYYLQFRNQQKIK